MSLTKILKHMRFMPNLILRNYMRIIYSSLAVNTSEPWL